LNTIAATLKRWKEFLYSFGVMDESELVSAIAHDPVDRAVAARMLSQYPALRAFYGDPRVFDSLMTPEDAKTMPDVKYLLRRVAMDDHYTATLSVRVHAKYMRTLIDWIGMPGNLLDAGCGWGFYPQFLIQEGFIRAEKVMAIDGSRVMIARARDVMDLRERHFPMRQYLINDIPPEPRYEMILCIDVLMHVIEWEQAIETLYDRLLPGGKLFLGFPPKFTPRSEIPAERALEIIRAKGGDIACFSTFDVGEPLTRCIIMAQKPS